MSKPIKLYSHAGGPNPWKVAIILEELKIPYETEMMQFPDLKKDPFESINPNGRVPAIEDPNTGLKLWESGAIIEYLLETYDKDNSLSYTKGAEKFEQKCWLHFQMSGQGKKSQWNVYERRVRLTIACVQDLTSASVLGSFFTIQRRT